MPWKARLAGVDEVGIHLSLCGVRPNAQQAVLALQLYANARGGVVTHKPHIDRKSLDLSCRRGHANAQVHVHAICEIPGCPPAQALS